MDGIVVFPYSKALGASFNAACNAKELVGGVPVEVIDPRTILTAQGFVALKAAAVAAQGGTMEEVVQAAQSIIRKVHVFWAWIHLST